MEKISQIAVPYAKALFDLALEKDVLENVTKDMQLLVSICKSNREFLLMLKSPILKTDKKKKIMAAVFAGALSTVTTVFFTILIDKKREPLLPDIASAFLGLYMDYKKILTTIVKTPVPLTESSRKQIIEIMKEHTENTIDLVEEIDEDLIGGFILQWKDMQYDASILHQMQKMKREMADINLFKKGY